MGLLDLSFRLKFMEIIIYYTIDKRKFLRRFALHRQLVVITLTYDVIDSKSNKIFLHVHPYIRLKNQIYRWTFNGIRCNKKNRNPSTFTHCCRIGISAIFKVLTTFSNGIVLLFSSFLSRTAKICSRFSIAPVLANFRYFEGFEHIFRRNNL